MKSVKMLLAMIMVALFQYGGAQVKTLLRAYNEGAIARVSGYVVGEEGVAVSNAEVCVSFRSQGLAVDNHEIHAKTDVDGFFGVAYRTNWKVECVIRKKGYYDSRFEVSFYDTERNRIDKDCWVNDGLNRRIVIRKILKNKSLSVFSESRRMGTWKIPVKNEWLGFDFEVYDWIAPYGIGRESDVLLKFSAWKRNHIQGCYQMQVSFTNNPYAGAYLGKADGLSDLKIPHFANKEQRYMDSLCFERKVLGTAREDSFPGKNDYVVFRTRTRTDGDGNLVSACYGVISGVWISGETTMRMEDSAFNVTENDINIEDGYYLRQVLRQYEGRNRTDVISQNSYKVKLERR